MGQVFFWLGRYSLCFLILSFLLVSPTVISSPAQLQFPDLYTLVGEKSYLTGYEPTNQSGDLNVVVEISTGTIDKWEVTKPDGKLKWEFKKGKPRKVNYLGYPGNYGMVPKTLLPKELGGDGDPVDVIVLGPAVARGSVIQAKLIGVLKLLDKGEQDDKLIAVAAGTPLYAANSLKELNQKYVGVADIVEIWFLNYKGPGKMQAQGFGDVLEARKILNAAIAAFKMQFTKHKSK